MSWGAAIGGIAGGIASLFGGSQARNASGEAHDWAVEDDQRNKAWMERMSNTAHQREVEDLRKAGLNPILSAGGGAGASSPSSGLPDVDKADTPDYQKAVSSAIEAALTEKQMKVMDKQAEQHETAAQLNRETSRKTKREADVLGPESTIMEKANEALQSGAKNLNEFGKWLGDKLSDDYHVEKAQPRMKGKP